MLLSDTETCSKSGTNAVSCSVAGCRKGCDRILSGNRSLTRIALSEIRSGRWSEKSQSLQAALEGVPGHPQLFRGLALVAARLIKGLADHLAFGMFKLLLK